MGAHNCDRQTRGGNVDASTTFTVSDDVSQAIGYVKALFAMLKPDQVLVLTIRDHVTVGPRTVVEPQNQVLILAEVTNLFAGLTARTLARTMGVTPSYWSKLRHGQIALTRRMADRIIQNLDLGDDSDIAKSMRAIDG